MHDRCKEFESSVNSYGGKTGCTISYYPLLFESSVNSYGGKTLILLCCRVIVFESSVNSYGGKTEDFSYSRET